MSLNRRVVAIRPGAVGNWEITPPVRMTPKVGYAHLGVRVQVITIRAHSGGCRDVRHGKPR